MSVGSRRAYDRFGDYSPNKQYNMSQDEGNVPAFFQGTPNMGDGDEETRQLRNDLHMLQDRHRRIEAEWQKRIDDARTQNHRDLEKLQDRHKQAENITTEQKD